MFQFNGLSQRAPKLLTAISFVAASLALSPLTGIAASSDMKEDRAEQRIAHMHQKLNITSAQEAQWAKVAQVMRDDAKELDGLTRTRRDSAKSMTAIDDLKSYADIADAHSAGIKKMIPAFADLYAGMSDSQKKEADKLFREGEHGHRHSMTK